MYKITGTHALLPQMFTYPSLSPVSMNAISGVISPTTFSLLASPVATPRTTPRTTPIPRWTTPFIPLDENVDYSLMVNMVNMAGAATDGGTPSELTEGAMGT